MKVKFISIGFSINFARRTKNRAAFRFGYAHPKETGHANKDHHWDVLIFTQEWPMTVCEVWKEKNSSNKCIMPSAQNSWTIQGIWPTKYGSTEPSYCNKSAHFDPTAVKTIEKEFNEVWLDIHYGAPPYSFWAHEWSKHGTCAAETLEKFNTELKYFTRGLEYHKPYNMSNILREADIAWNKGYDVVDIVNAVRAHLDVNPVVECRHISGKNHLHEIRICFSKFQ